MPDDANPPALSWQELMEGLTVGAARGTADAHEQLNIQAGGQLSPLNEEQLFDAALVLSALALEAAIDGKDRDEALARAARNVRRTFLSHLGAFRRIHDATGEPALYSILERAGIERRRLQ